MMIENFIRFIEIMPPWQKMLAVIGSLVFCWLLEWWVPLFKFSYNKIKHAGINLSFFVGISVINLIFGLILVNGLWYFEQYKLGLFFHLKMPLVFEVLFAVLILDFVAQYLVHFCLHKIKWMWKFHRIHHSDKYLDATSGTRHHPGDYLLREIFSFIALVLLGIPVAYYFLFRFLTIFFTYINHANIRVPKKLNYILGWVFVTPDIHKIHHHYQQPWTDSNYGNIFSFWDRIFGTLIDADSKKVVYGLDELGAGFQDKLGLLWYLPFININEKK